MIPKLWEIFDLCKSMKIEFVENMKNISTKKQERLEKKKKKLAALAEMIKLNDKDRNIKHQTNSSSGSRSSYSNSDNEISIESDKNRSKVPKRNETYDSQQIEPKQKKMKMDDSTEEMDISNNKINSSNNIEMSAFNTDISDEQYVTIKKSLNKRKHAPQFHLKEYGELASLSVNHDDRTPIFLTDIQHLLMGSLISSDIGSIPTRWCTIEKLGKLSHSVVLIVEGISLFHYLSYQNHFQETNKIFDHKLEVILPKFEEGKILKELATVPLTAAQKDQLIEKYGSIETAIEMNKDPTFMVKEVFPIEKSDIEKSDESEKNDDIFPRTKLLLSALQMVDEGYPLPLRGELARRYQTYKFTKTVYEKVTSNSPLFGLDCEMCKTSAGINELTRISIVDESFKSIYDTLVRPTNTITDYLTQYSGITPEMMLSVTKRLQEVQHEVSQLLPPDAILVGQSLHSDLHAMKMMHPYVIDTSVIFNLTGDRKRKSKLKLLAEEFLGESIQAKLGGHDSTEDSIASLKLTKLKLLKGLDFGDILLIRKKEQNKAKKMNMNITNNFFACVSKVEKTAVIVTAQEIPKELKDEIEGKYKINSDDKETHSLENTVRYYKMDGNKSAIHKAKEVVYDHSLTICNVNVAPQQLELSRIEKSIENIDKWVNKLHECVSSNGLFILLIGGSPGSTSGVAMIKIKKQTIGTCSETSITV